MSKRAIIFIFLGIFVILALLLTNFGRNLSFLPFFPPKFTEEIPDRRPPRLDRRLLVRFEGVPMKQILDTLSREEIPPPKADPVELPRTVEAAPEDVRMLASLPDAPLPFPEGAAPADAAFLKEFVTSFDSESEEKPDPDHLWRFNQALAALAIAPDQLPESIREQGVPEPEAETLGIEFASRECPLSGPFAIGDFDGGGDLEAIDRGGLRMTTLDGSGSPIPIAGVVTSHPGDSLEAEDFDGDGDLDLYVARRNGLPDSLLRNDGEGNFEDITVEVGLLAFRDTLVARWLDYDRDGLPDLLVGSRHQPLELYHQTEGGAFQPVAWDLKLWIPWGVDRIEVGDFLGDEHPDLFLGIAGLRDRFLRSTPGATWADWRFEDVSAETTLAVDEDGEVVLLDFDADGRLDVATFAPGVAGIRLFRSEGDDSFEEIGEGMGLSAIPSPVSLQAFDFDNDGYLDLHCGTPQLQMNRLLWNRGGSHYREVTVATRSGFLDRPVETTSVDWEADGSADLIYRNAAGAVRWLEPEGSLQDWIRVTFDRRCQGARIVAEVRDQDWIVHRHESRVRRGDEILLGVSDGDVIESLTVYLPGREDPVARLEQLEPGTTIPVTLPERPRKRPVTPVSTGAPSPSDS